MVNVRIYLTELQQQLNDTTGTIDLVIYATTNSKSVSTDAGINVHHILLLCRRDSGSASPPPPSHDAPSPPPPPAPSPPPPVLQCIDYFRQCSVVVMSGVKHLSHSLCFLLQVAGGGSRLMMDYMNHIGPHFWKHQRPATS